MFLAEDNKLARDIRRQGIGERLCEFADRFMNEGATVGGAGRRVDRFEREQPQHMFGVDRVGITQPVFDVGDAQLRGPRFRRWGRLRPRGGRDPGGMIEGACVIRVDCATRQRFFPAGFAGDRRQPLNEAGSHRRCARLLGSAREEDLGGAQPLGEIVRRKADAQLRQIETEFEPHRTAQPRIAAGIGRPGAFVEATEHEPVDALQPGFQQAEDAHARIADLGAPLGTPRCEQMEDVRVVGWRQFERVRCRTFRDGFEGAVQLSPVGASIGGNGLSIACQRLERSRMRLRQREQAVRLVAKRFQRGEPLREPFGQPFGRVEIGRQDKATRIVAVQLAAALP